MDTASPLEGRRLINQPNVNNIITYQLLWHRCSKQLDEYLSVKYKMLSIFSKHGNVELWYSERADRVYCTMHINY